MEFESDKFKEFVFKNNIVGFFEEPIKLSSGRLSHHYVNWRDVAKDTFLLDEATNHLLGFIKHLGLQPRCFFGAPEGATKLAVLSGYKWAKANSDYAPGVYPLPMGRGKPKDHGDPKDKFFVGVPSGPTVVLEDTTTTGRALLQAIESVQSAGAEVIAAVALMNRNEIREDGLSVKSAVEKMGVPYHALGNLRELLPELYERLRPSSEVKQAVEDYFKQYGGPS